MKMVFGLSIIWDPRWIRAQMISEFRLWPVKTKGCSLPIEKVLVATIFVITSYSIHYTKLYELSQLLVSPVRMPDRFRIIVDRCLRTLSRIAAIGRGLPARFIDLVYFYSFVASHFTRSFRINRNFSTVLQIKWFFITNELTIVYWIINGWIFISRQSNLV